MARAFALCLLALALLPPAAAAEVKVSRRADGTLVMHNDGARAPQAPPRLRRAPSEGWQELIRNHAARQELQPELVQAVIQVESAYDPRAVSKRGAMGLMQLMPDTARLLGVDDPFDPDQNIGGGAAYLRRMLDLFEGSVELALAAYNAGPGAVQRHRGVPPYRETHDYVRKVVTLWRGRPPVSLPVGVLPPPPAATSRPAQVRPVTVRRDPSNRLVVTTSVAGR
jgi:soluble lytic murein transglycosylase-like protein